MFGLSPPHRDPTEIPIRRLVSCRSVFRPSVLRSALHIKSKRANSPPWFGRGAPSRDGRRGGWFKKTNFWINTTPALRATPARLEEGSSALVPNHELSPIAPSALAAKVTRTTLYRVT